MEQWSKNGHRSSKVKNFLSRVKGVLFLGPPFFFKFWGGGGGGMGARKNMNLGAQVRKYDVKEGN